MRQALVIANWKMHGSRSENEALLAGIQAGLSAGANTAQVAVCPPAVYLSEVANGLAGSSIQLGAQDVSFHNPGAHTGDLAAEMLVDIGCHYVIVGHSERRANHHESDEMVARKFYCAHEAGLKPILCVGETLDQRQAGRALQVVAEQMEAVLDNDIGELPATLIIAYEPVWAIGTGQTATAEQAQEVHQFIRQQLAVSGEESHILYGGSVKPDNAQALFSQPDIDGGLIGSASLEVESFVAICHAANNTGK